MSYILDALKKADAERERGSVPGLHSQPLGQVDDDEDAASRRPVPPAMWLVAGAGICLIAVLSWQLLSQPAAPAAEPAAAPMGTTQAPPDQNSQPARADSMPAGVEQRAPQAPQSPLVTTPPPMPAERPPAIAQHAPPPSPAVTPTQAPPEQVLTQPTAPPAAAVREAPARAAAQAPQAAPKPAAQAAQTAQVAPPATRVPTLSELPDDIKRDLPQLTIGGAMYSDTPSSRMLIINSQVFHEGDQPYQGLVLEEIRLKSAVFKYRGYRYAINY